MKYRDYDPAEAMVTYRMVISELNVATTPVDKASLNGIARRLRAEWEECEGEDSLHQSAYGEAL